MRQLHEHFLEAMAAERQRLHTRRGLLTGGAKLAAGGALALAVGGAARPDRLIAVAQNATSAANPFKNDVDVLNYALTLEHLEYAFYRDGVASLTFGKDGFGNSIGDYLMMIRDHEKAHVDTLTKVITDLGGTPVAEAKYNFGYGSDPAKFLATAMALENTGVRAYDGAGQYLKSKDLLVAAGGIVAVEARHAAYLNLINGQIPFPAPMENPATPAEILKIAGPFIVS